MNILGVGPSGLQFLPIIYPSSYYYIIKLRRLEILRVEGRQVNSMNLNILSWSRISAWMYIVMNVVYTPSLLLYTDGHGILIQNYATVMFSTLHN